MSVRTDDHDLREVFNRYGRVDHVRVIRDGHGNSRGFGFVYFSSVLEATKASLWRFFQLASVLRPSTACRAIGSAAWRCVWTTR